MALLEATKRVCAASTTVHVSVPNAQSFHRLLAVEMGLIGTPTELSTTQQTLQQHRTFTQESLGDLVRASGFKVLEQGSYFLKPFTHGQMQELRDSGFLTPAMLEGLWGMTRHMPGLGSEIFVNLQLAS
jgi:hypothetical protein